jgi:hypothetical protein
MRARAMVVLLCFCLFTIARAADPAPVYAAPAPPPAKYGALTWSYGGTNVDGYWYTNDQVWKTSARIDYLEIKAAKVCVDQQIDAAKNTSDWWKIALGVAAGAGIGFCAAAQGHCGMYK